MVTCPTRLSGPVGLTVDPTGVWFRPEGEQFLTGSTPRPDVAADPEDFTPRGAEFENEIWPALAERVPAFDSLRVVRSGAGHYDFCTLDHNVVLGPHPEVRNFLFASGFSGHGLQQAPAVGRGLAELLVHGAYRTLDLSPLGYERVSAARPFPEDAVI